VCCQSHQHRLIGTRDNQPAFGLSGSDLDLGDRTRDDIMGDAVGFVGSGSTVAAKKCIAAAATALGRPDLATAVERERNWRGRYFHHIVELHKAGCVGDVVRSARAGQSVASRNVASFVSHHANSPSQISVMCSRFVRVEVPQSIESCHHPHRLTAVTDSPRPLRPLFSWSRSRP
jgi:hypothetical protein